VKTSNYRYFIFALALSGLLSLSGCKSSTPTEGEKSGGGEVAGSPTRNGCYNAYYPASATLKKTYKTTFAGNGIPSSTHTESYSNVTAEGFTQKMDFSPSDKKSKDGQPADPVTLEGGIKCKPEGLMAMEYGNLTAGQNTKFD
jgi:hypothetical protein